MRVLGEHIVWIFPCFRFKSITFQQEDHIAGDINGRNKAPFTAVGSGRYGDMQALLVISWLSFLICKNGTLFTLPIT